LLGNSSGGGVVLSGGESWVAGVRSGILITSVGLGVGISSLSIRGGLPLLTKTGVLESLPVISGEIGLLERRPSSHLRNLLVDGLFGSLGNVLHLCPLIVDSSERSLFFVEFCLVVSEGLLDDSGFVDVLLPQLSVLVLFSLVGGVFELGNVLGSGNVGRGLHSGSLLFHDGSSLLELFLGLVVQGHSLDVAEVFDVSEFLGSDLAGGDIGGLDSDLGEDVSESSVLVLEGLDVLLDFLDFSLSVDLHLLGGLVDGGLGLQLDVVGSELREGFLHGEDFLSQIVVLGSECLGVSGNFGVFLDLLLEGLNFEGEFDVVDFVSVDGFSERSVGGFLGSGNI